MKKFIFSVFLSSLLISFSYSADPPEKIYSVQVGAYETPQEAEFQKAQFKALGYSRVFVEHIDTWFKVLVGNFETYWEAYVWKTAIREKDCPDAFIQSFPFTDPADLGLQNVGPIPTVFQLKVSTVTQLPDLQLPVDDTVTTQIHRLLNQNRVEEAEVELTKWIPQLPDTDVRKGWAHVRLGILLLRNKDFYGALNLFEPVAQGEITSRRIDRIKAMRRVGWVHHQLREPILAWKAYTELEGFSDDPLVKAITKMERAGILMEQELSAKGTKHECLRFIQTALEEIGEQYSDERATLELMGAEIINALGRKEEVVQRCRSIVERYPASRVPCAQAQYLLARTLEDLGRPEEAFHEYQTLLERYRDEDNFNPERSNVRAYALLRCGFIRLDSGDTTGAIQFWQEVINQYPGTGIAQAAQWDIEKYETEGVK